LTNFAFDFRFLMAGLAQDFADLGRAGLTERVEKDTRLGAVSAFRDAFALKIMFAWARRSSSLNRDLDTPSTLAVFRAVANGALIRVVISCILHLRFVPFHRTVRTLSLPASGFLSRDSSDLGLSGSTAAGAFRRHKKLVPFAFLSQKAPKDVKNHSTLMDDRNPSQAVENNRRRYAPLDTLVGVHAARSREREIKGKTPPLRAPQGWGTRKGNGDRRSRSLVAALLGMTTEGLRRADATLRRS
jgi:hypothetical protein